MKNRRSEHRHPTTCASRAPVSRRPFPGGPAVAAESLVLGPSIVTAVGHDTPSQTALGSLTIRIGATEIEPLAVELTPDSVVVALPQVVRRQAVQFDLRVNVFENPYAFNAFVGHTDDTSFWQQVDPVSRIATTVFLPEVPAALNLLDKIVISPEVLTPNGDGINDQLQVSYILLRALSEVPINVTLYDLSGRTVRRLQNSGALNGPQLLTWDGRNEDGAMTPPGMYLLRLSIDTDTGSENRPPLGGLAY